MPVGKSNKRAASTQSVTSVDVLSLSSLPHFNWSLSETSLLNDLLAEDKEEPQDTVAGKTTTTLRDSGDVCFKMRSHPGTSQWREVVKEWSLHPETFPDWRDHYCDAIQERLRQEYGIQRFLLCRDSDGIKPSVKLNGNWHIATPEEILARTKQRFLDDRKAANKVLPIHEKKRNPGRPKKEQKRNESPGSVTQVSEALERIWKIEWKGESPFR
jgi:hypothetical protein